MKTPDCRETNELEETPLVGLLTADQRRLSDPWIDHPPAMRPGAEVERVLSILDSLEKNGGEG